MSAKIRVIHAESKSRYGSPRVHDELLDQGINCGRKRVERLMRREGLKAKAAKKFKVTTDSSHAKPVAADLVKRDFTASAPNKIWVGDITYLWTKEGWLYRPVLTQSGWLGNQLQTSSLTCNACL